MAWNALHALKTLDSIMELALFVHKASFLLVV